MELQMRRRTDFFGKRGNIIRAADIFKRSVFGKLLYDGVQVNRLLCRRQLQNSLVNFFVRIGIKTVRAQNIQNVNLCTLLNHYRAEHHLLQLQIVRRYPSVLVVDVHDKLFLLV